LVDKAVHVFNIAMDKAMYIGKVPLIVVAASESAHHRLQRLSHHARRVPEQHAHKTVIVPRSLFHAACVRASIPVLAILSPFCFFLSSVNNNHKLCNSSTSVMSYREGNDDFSAFQKTP
jgi:hypothetical protein